MDGDLFVVMEYECASGLQLSRFVCAPKIVELVLQLFSIGISEGDFEGKILCIILWSLDPVCNDRLFDGKLSCFRLYFRLVCDYHYVQKTKQTGKVQIIKVVLIRRQIIFITGVIMSSPVLHHSGTDEAFFSDKERLINLTSVFIMKSVVDHGVLSIMKVHGALNRIVLQGSLKLHVFPVLRFYVLIFGGLRLPDGGNVTQSDINFALFGKLLHGLGQTAYTCHYRYAVICFASVSINRVGSYYNGRDGFVDVVTSRCGNFLEVVVCSAAACPHNFSMTVCCIDTGGEDQQTVLSGFAVRECNFSSFPNCNLGFALFVAVQPKLNAIQGLAVLVHLHHPKFPLFVGDIYQRAEIPVELAGTQKAESIAAAGVFSADAHDFIDGVINTISFQICLQS